MKLNIPINTTDIIILIILGVMFVLGIRVVCGFFKEAQKPESTDAYGTQKNAAETEQTGEERG